MAAVEGGDVNFEDVLHAFTHSDTKELLDRQSALLRRVCTTYENGFKINVLGHVAELMGILLSRLDQLPQEFETHLCAVIKLCALPFVRDVSNEELRPQGSAAMSALVQMLSLLVQSDRHSVQLGAAITLRTIAQANVSGPIGDVYEMQPPSPRVHDLRPAGRDLHMKLVREANVFPIFVDQFQRLVTTFAEGIAELDRAEEQGRQESVMEGTSARGGTAGSAQEDSDDSDAEEEAEADPRAEGGGGDAATTSTGGKAGQGTAELKSRLGRIKQRTAAVLLLLRELTTNKVNARTLAYEGILDPLTLLLACVKSAREPEVLYALETMWNCLENCVGEVPKRDGLFEELLIEAHGVDEPIVPIDIEYTLQVLHDLFGTLLHDCFRLVDKHLRNEVLIVITLIARLPQSTPYFVSTDLLRSLLTYAVAAEAPAGAWWAYAEPLAPVRNYASVTEADMELKRTIWTVLLTLAKRGHDPVLAMIADSPLIATLLSYLLHDSMPSSSGAGAGAGGSASIMAANSSAAAAGAGSVAGAVEESQWMWNSAFIHSIPPTLLQELQQEAMTVLLYLASRCRGELYRLDGHRIALLVVEHYSASPHPDHRKLVHGAMLLLKTVVAVPRMLKELQDLDGVDSVVRRFVESDHVPTRVAALSVVAEFCNNGNLENQTALRNSGGLDVFVEELQRYATGTCGAAVAGGGGGASTLPHGQMTSISRLQSSLSTHTSSSSLGGATGSGGAGAGTQPRPFSVLVVNIVHCMWNAVVGNRKSELKLAQLGGLDSLLTVLEVCPPVMRHQILGFWADLFQSSPELSRFVASWRSPFSMRSMLSLLMLMWREEEERLGYASRNGVLRNLWAPLREQEWRNEASSNDLLRTTRADGASSGAGKGATLMSSAAFARLGTALEHAHAQSPRADAAGGGDEGVREAVVEDILSHDARAKIASLVQSIGVRHTIEMGETVDGVDPTEKIYLAKALRYDDLRIGEAWNQLKKEVENAGILPIAADYVMLTRELDRAFEVAHEVQWDQLQCTDEQAQEVKTIEQNFLGSILLQKDQQIKQAAIKHKSNRNSATSGATMGGQEHAGGKEDDEQDGDASDANDDNKASKLGLLGMSEYEADSSDEEDDAGELRLRVSAPSIPTDDMTGSGLEEMME